MKNILKVYPTYKRMQFAFKETISELERDGISFTFSLIGRKIICSELDITFIFRCVDNMQIQGMKFNEVVYDELCMLTAEEEALIRSRVGKAVGL